MLVSKLVARLGYFLASLRNLFSNLPSAPLNHNSRFGGFFRRDWACLSPARKYFSNGVFLGNRPDLRCYIAQLASSISRNSGKRVEFLQKNRWR
jgi:hypothetical protein